MERKVVVAEKRRLPSNEETKARDDRKNRSERVLPMRCRAVLGRTMR